MQKSPCISWRKVITVRKTIKPPRNISRPTIRPIPRANIRNCPVSIQATVCISIRPILAWIRRKAIEQLQLYLEYYPQSERASQAQDILFELQEKLAFKELMAARLYFNLGTYMGNNLLSSVITSQNALKNYPYTKYREEFMFLIIRAKYELAIVSVEEKLQGRYRDVVDEYYTYLNEYPEGKYLKQVQKYFDYANKRINDTY